MINMPLIDFWAAFPKLRHSRWHWGNLSPGIFIAPYLYARACVYRTSSASAMSMSIVSWASDTLIISFPIKFITAAGGGGRDFWPKPRTFDAPAGKNFAWFVIKCVWHLPESNHPSFFSRIYQTKLCFQFSGGLYYFLSHGWLALYFPSSARYINNIFARNSAPHIIINVAPYLHSFQLFLAWWTDGRINNWKCLKQHFVIFQWITGPTLRPRFSPVLPFYVCGSNTQPRRKPNKLSAHPSGWQKWWLGSDSVSGSLAKRNYLLPAVLCA